MRWSWEMAMPVNPLRMSLTIMFYGFQFPRGRRAISTFAPPCLDSKFAPYFILSVSSRWASILITMLHWTPRSTTLDRSVFLCHRFEIKKDVNFESRSLEEREEEEWRVLFPKRKEKNISNAAARKEASFSVIRMFRSQKSSQVFKSLTSCCP